MSHRLTKEELDEQFELFLKEVKKHVKTTNLLMMDYHAIDEFYVWYRV